MTPACILMGTVGLMRGGGGRGGGAAAVMSLLPEVQGNCMSAKL